MQHCLIPAFNTYKEVMSANENNDANSYQQLLTLLSNVNLRLIQFQQSVYVPQIQLQLEETVKAKISENQKLGLKTKIEDFNLDDNEFINSLSKTVTKWTADIQQVIKQQFELVNVTSL